MKKSIIIIILLLTIKSYSQDYNNQSFKVTDFYLLNNGTTQTDKGGLSFSFDVSASRILKDAYDYPYYLNIKFFDTNGQLIYQDDRAAKLFAKADFFDETKTENQYVKIVIPFEKLKIPPGKQQIKLEISAENNEKEFPVFFKKTILAKIPQMFHYYEQVFNVDSFLSKQIQENKVAGIGINFKYHLKFDVSQIRDLKEHPEYGDYVFYVKFFKNGKEIKLFENKNAEKKIRPLLKTNYLQLFVPLSDLKLPEGKHQIQLKLYATTDDRMYDAGEILNQDINVQQPKLYTFTFSLTHCSVKDNNYDVSSVLGQVFSSSTSNKGKGYPDVYWMIKTGNIIKYISPVWDNVLMAPEATTSFIIAEDDPLIFIVYDRDFPSQDDFIGQKIIENIPKEYDIKIEDYKDSGIYDTSFSYTKKVVTDY